MKKMENKMEKDVCGVGWGAYKLEQPIILALG